MTAADIAGYTRDRAGADAHRLPRPRHLRHGAVFVRRHDRRRIAEHPRELRPLGREHSAEPAPVSRGDRARVRRPQRVRRRSCFRRCADRDPAQPGVRRRAGVRDRSERRVGEAGSRRTADCGGLRCARRGGARGHREPLDHPPLGRRQVGQRGRVHAHDRADRRLGHDRARPRLPAEQRAHRLQLHPQGRGSGFRRGSEHHRAGQAPAVVDVTDDRARRRRRSASSWARPVAR